MIKWIALAAVIFSSLAYGAAEPEGDLPNFHEVVRGAVYRGGQPSPRGFQSLAKMGVRMFIDLRAERPDIAAQEKKLLGELNVGFAGEPMTAYQNPNPNQINQIETLLADRTNQPVFIHCHYGEDRTGLLIGLFRVRQHMMNPQQAYNEMLEIGFHQSLVVLKRYYCRETGYCP